MSKYVGKIVTNQAPAGYSVFFDGSGDFLSIAASSAFNFGAPSGNTNDFTIEMWVYPTRSAFVDYELLYGTGGSGGQDQLNLYANGTAQYYDGINNVISPVLRLNQWNHIAVVRNGASSNNLRVYANGVSGTAVTSTNALGSSVTSPRIGLRVDNFYPLQGYISNVRVVKGTALYTAAFTPPTQLLSVTNTSLLTCNSPAIVDQSSNAFAITVNGNAAVSTFTPFTAYVPYNPALGASTPGVWTLDEALQAKGTRQWNMYDPYFNLTTLLLHGNGTNTAQNNTFLDSSSNNFSITRNPASGPNAPTQGSFSPFSAQPGAWSSYYSGVADTNGTYFAANAAYSFGTGDFTVEAWINIPPISNTYGKMIVDSRPNATNGSYWLFGFTNTGQLTGETMTTGGTTITSTSAIPTNQWVHVAYTRASGTLNLWVNGVSVASATGNTNNISSDTLWVGRNAFSGSASDTWFSGYMSNLRIVKGVAVYTGTFTPPASPLEKTQSAGINIAAITGSQTSLLFNQSNRFVDNSNTNATPLTLNTWPTIQPFSPFYPTAAYTPATIGGSGYFDGTGDYLQTPSTGQFAPTGNWTISLWFYPTALASVQDLIGNYTTNTAADWTWVVNSNGSIDFYLAGASVVTMSAAAGTIKLNQWHFISVSRSTNTVTAYVNGSQVATASYSQTLGSASKAQYVGSRFGSFVCTGYISDVRMVDGQAITSVPTTPTTTTTGSVTASNTKLLLNFTNAGIVDSTAKNVLETAGNAQISTTQSKFGGSSMYFDGTGDALTIPAPQKENLRFGTGDFTIEFWAWKSANGSAAFDTVISVGSDGNYNGGFAVELSSSRGFCFIYDAAVRISSNFNPNDSTWHHYAVVRNGSTFALYRDGVQLTTATLTPTLGITGNALVGAGVSSTQSNFNGYLDDLRVTKGFARYTTTFTPQTSQWQDQ